MDISMINLLSKEFIKISSSESRPRKEELKVGTLKNVKTSVNILYICM